MFSIVIPAHNEAAVIGRCLDALLSEPPQEGMEIIVACNGCTDNTAAIAASYEGVRVVDIPEASKIAGLNAGDAAATNFPRAYVDADVRVTGRALEQACRVLDQSQVKVTAPALRVDLSRSNLGVKAFYSIWMRLPYFSKGEMVGSGIYILSEQGRARFDHFPQIISDDGYVRGLFAADERKMDAVSHFTIYAPRTLRELIKIKTRARFGNMEVEQKYPAIQVGGENGAKDLLAVVARNPLLLVNAVIYCFIQLQTKRKALARMVAADYHTWERDNSSRS